MNYKFFFLVLFSLICVNNIFAQRKVFTKKNGITIMVQEEPRIGECQLQNGKKMYQHRITVYAVNENAFEVTFNKPLAARVPEDAKLPSNRDGCWDKLDRGKWRDLTKLDSRAEATLITKIVLSENINTAGRITCEIPDLKK
ncbi:MAG: hypothetical protein EAZ85_01340 [Bacteroidetes bacterium]|nr:MAG: hypothetical protein EAZ85_01340 [Bacteroidota bacterium]